MKTVSMAKVNTCSEEHLSELIDHYGKLVFSLCYNLTGDYFVSEDLSQDTFLTVYQKYDQFQGENEKAWICRIATNKSIDFLRSASNKSIPAESEFFSEIQDERGSPEEHYIENEIKENLVQFCESLKPPYDEIAKEYYLKEKTAAQIAKEKGIGLKTVQTQIYRARSMLQKFRKEVIQC